MLEDIENRLILTIIVKDMSRFRRKYNITELVFRKYSVKVIRINDNYDSSSNNDNLRQSAA